MSQIQNIISDEKELINTLASCMAIKNELKDKKLFNLSVFESEIGSFPDNINKFVERLMRLQGYNLNFFQKEGFGVFAEIHKIQNDRVLIIVIAF